MFRGFVNSFQANTVYHLTLGQFASSYFFQPYTNPFIIKNL